MLTDGVRITRQLEDARFSTDGKMSAIIRVEFMVGDHGPFVERFPKDGFTGQSRDDRLNAFAREIAG